MAAKSKRKTNPKTRRLKGPLAAAVAHPVRTQALAILGERVASPAEIAKEVDVYVGKVGYHVNELAEANLVEEVGSRPVRGAVEHFYKGIELPEISAEQEDEMSHEARATFGETVVALFAADVAGAIRRGTYLKRTDHHMTRLVRLTDERGYKDLAAAHMALFETTQEILEEAAERMAEQSASDKKKNPPMRVLNFQAMMQLAKAPKGEAPEVTSLLPPISGMQWDGESTSGEIADKSG